MSQNNKDIQPSVELSEDGDGLDGWMAICIRCKEPGELICCDNCPRVYHTHCLKKDETNEKNEWKCPGCFADDDMLVKVEQKDAFDMCKDVLERLLLHDLFSLYFLEPVEKNLQGALARKYQKIIACPMDLSTVRRRVHQGGYSSQTQKAAVDFCRDVWLIGTNCCLFNEEGSAVHRVGTLLSTKVKEFIAKKLVLVVNQQSAEKLASIEPCVGSSIPKTPPPHSKKRSIDSAPYGSLQALLAQSTQQYSGRKLIRNSVWNKRKGRHKNSVGKKIKEASFGQHSPFLDDVPSTSYSKAATKTPMGTSIAFVQPMPIQSIFGVVGMDHSAPRLGGQVPRVSVDAQTCNYSISGENTEETNAFTCKQLLLQAMQVLFAEVIIQNTTINDFQEVLVQFLKGRSTDKLPQDICSFEINAERLLENFLEKYALNTTALINNQNKSICNYNILGGNTAEQNAFASKRFFKEAMQDFFAKEIIQNTSISDFQEVLAQFIKGQSRDKLQQEKCSFDLNAERFLENFIELFGIALNTTATVNNQAKHNCRQIEVNITKADAFGVKFKEKDQAVIIEEIKDSKAPQEVKTKLRTADKIISINNSKINLIEDAIKEIVKVKLGTSMQFIIERSSVAFQQKGTVNNAISIDSEDEDENCPLEQAIN